MKKLSVLFICGWYPSRVLPTNGDFVERHAIAISKKHLVSVIHIITDQNLKKKFEIISDKKKGITTHIGYIKPTKNPFFKGFLFLNVFFRILKKISKTDVVHLNEIYPFGLFCLFFKWIKKVPFIVTEHFTGYIKSSGYRLGYFEQKISQIIIKNAYRVCPVSTFLKTEMINHRFNGKYKVVPNTINTNLFTPKTNDSKVLKLIHISSLKDDHKNISGMLRVAKLLSERIPYFEWNFVGGDGNHYKEYLNELDIKNCVIKFLPHQKHSKIVSYLQDATICISFSNYETFGIVIPEAIACGTPVIATETGIACDLKKEFFCKSISIGDESQLLKSILNYKILFEKLNVNKMHNYIQENFGESFVADKFSILYFKAIKK